MSTKKNRLLLIIFLLTTISVGVSFSSLYWCAQIRPMGIDLCWVIGATSQQLEPFYPSHHYEIFLFFRLILVGFPCLLFISALVVLLRKTTKQNRLLFSVSLIAALLMAEIILRSVGRGPGVLSESQWITPVDSLYKLYGFTADENGIFKVDTAVANEMNIAVSENIGPLLGVKTFFVQQSRKWAPEALAIHKDHVQISDCDNPFSKKIKAIKQVLPRTAFDSLLVDYVRNPINIDGFYSVPFDANSGEAKKVLLLGDSFTWGHSTDNKTSSFANTLLAKGFHVCNTGISGADVAQYKQVIKTYMDSINPDVVILNFYMGNDVSYFQRIPIPHIPIHFSTNAGNILSFQEGIQQTNAQDAYDNVIRNMIIQETTFVNWMAAQTSMGTLVWQVLVKFNLLEDTFYKGLPRPEKPVCNKEIEWISKFCHNYKVPFVLSVIPNLVDDRLDGAATVNHLFENIPYIEPEVTVDMYSSRDGHFNEKGHLFYANYLEDVIENLPKNH